MGWIRGFGPFSFVYLHSVANTVFFILGIEELRLLFSFSNNSIYGGYLLEMHILQVSASPQTITIIPRSFPASVTIELVDESTNTTATPAVTAASANGFMTLTGTFSLVNSRFYGLKVFNAGNLIYRDRVFVTSQTEYDKFTVNAGVYTEETTYDNEYIII
jgi:hypothetical protein